MDRYGESWSNQTNQDFVMTYPTVYLYCDHSIHSYNMHTLQLLRKRKQSMNIYTKDSKTGVRHMLVKEMLISPAHLLFVLYIHKIIHNTIV